MDHSTITRWVVKYSPQLDAACHRQHRPGGSWRLDVTYICLQGTWVYLYRAVDKSGQTLDFLLTPGRNRKVAKRVLAKAIRRNGMLEKITIEKGGANAAAIINSSYPAEQGTTIPLRTCTSLNTIVKQDHRGMKRITRPMLGFHFFTTAHHTLLVSSECG